MKGLRVIFLFALPKSAVRIHGELSLCPLSEKQIILQRVDAAKKHARKRRYVNCKRALRHLVWKRAFAWNRH
ncbi:hypothetical protein [Actibacterium lipolyticum]|uniref:Uncharacterized protein n=1 Tax=Actibacterium lipolyticum TaxID=1524263 RepID=A0A238JX16_9RHOB|nr:hypothetical protein [Actibacterium lipolyticum]SMX35198.1 hypothetical protein COL8621_01698 [Actibacterium lipolyticum]